MLRGWRVGNRASSFLFVVSNIVKDTRRSIAFIIHRPWPSRRSLLIPIPDPQIEDPKSTYVLFEEYTHSVQSSVLWYPADLDAG